MTITLDLLNPSNFSNEIKNLSIKTTQMIQLTHLNIISIVSSFSLIIMCYWFMELLLSSNKKFMDLTFDRKRYVIKNFIKAVYLYALTVYSAIYIKNMILYDIWDNNAIKLMGLMYCLPDFISLFRVPNMHSATVQHHMTTTTLALLNLFNDYSKDTHWRGMIIYGYLSMLTGIVNFYLGYRLIYAEDKLDLKKKLAKSAFVVYVASLLLNWSYQIYIVSKWVTVFPLFGLYAYLILIAFVVRDDIILVSFLYHEFSKEHKNN